MDMNKQSESVSSDITQNEKSNVILSERVALNRTWVVPIKTPMERSLRV